MADTGIHCYIVSFTAFTCVVEAASRNGKDAEWAVRPWLVRGSMLRPIHDASGHHPEWRAESLDEGVAAALTFLEDRFWPAPTAPTECAPDEGYTKAVRSPLRWTDLPPYADA